MKILSIEKMGYKFINKYIVDLHNICKFLEADHWFTYGTALGIYRDGKPIGSDLDIDVFALEQDKMKFLNYDWSKHDIDCVPYEFKGDITHLNCYRDNFIASITFNTENKDKMEHYSWTRDMNCYKVAIPKKFYYPINYMKYRNRKLPFPGHIEEYLKFIYGKSWKTPIDNRPTPEYLVKIGVAKRIKDD